MFQSQMRSRSTCDFCSYSYYGRLFCVSISDEKPLHMRLLIEGRIQSRYKCFNLR